MIQSFFPEICKAFLETLQMLLVSSLFTFVIGLPLGSYLYLSHPNSVRPRKHAYQIINVTLNVIRSFPFMLFVIAMIPITRKIVGTSLGTVAAMIPLSIIGITLFARQIEESLNAVPQEVLHTAISLGANIWELLYHFLYIEALPSLILNFSSVLITLISYSTVLGVVGGGGIGNFAMIYGYQRYQYDLMYTAIMIMILLVQAIHFLGRKAAHSVDRS